MDLTKIKVLEIKQEITPFKTPSGEEVRKITIVTENHGKPKFYSHKKGTDEETVAYKGFKTGKIVKGIEVNVKINEAEEQSFVNKDGKEIKFKPKWLSFFEDLSNLSEVKPNSITVDDVQEPDAGDIPF